MQALLHFPRVPAVFFCHDFLAWHDAAPRFPRIHRYVAVADTVRDRLVLEQGIPPERVRVVPNAVDLARFRPRGSLPDRPSRALVFSNYAREDTHLGAVREACRRAGIALDVVGVGTGTQSAAPEMLLPGYDLVFAKARCALEALAVGNAVVLCDYGGLGPMVTGAELERLRRANLGVRVLAAPLDPDLVVREIERYDPRDAEAVSRRIRTDAGLDAQLDILEALYEVVIAEEAERPADPVAEARALAAYLDAWGPRFKDGPLRTQVDEYRRRAEETEANRRQAHAETAWFRERAAALEEERGVLEARCRELEGVAEAHRGLTAEHARLGAEHARLGAELGRLTAERTALDTEVGRLREHVARLRGELDYTTGTATWRLRARLVRSRPLTAVYRALRRLVGAGPSGAQAAATRQSG
jgi:hypothetical protein